MKRRTVLQCVLAFFGLGAAKAAAGTGRRAKRITIVDMHGNSKVVMFGGIEPIAVPDVDMEILDLTRSILCEMDRRDGRWTVQVARIHFPPNITKVYLDRFNHGTLDTGWIGIHRPTWSGYSGAEKVAFIREMVRMTIEEYMKPVNPNAHDSHGIEYWIVKPKSTGI